MNRRYYKYDDYISAFKEECYYSYWSMDYLYWYNSRYFAPCMMKKVKNISEVKWWNKWEYLVWEIEIIVPYERNNIIVNNFIPAWAEIVNTNLNTTSSEIKDISKQENSSWWGWYDHIESRDEKVTLYSDHLSKWTYKYTYVLKLNHKWIYHNRPAVAEELKKPEIFGRTSWGYFEIK